MISQDEVVTDNGDVKLLPYKTGTSTAPLSAQAQWPQRVGSQSRLPTEPLLPLGNITVFRQTSTHLQMATSFGLELVIQLQPVFQVYVTVGPQFRGQTRGESRSRLPKVSPDALSPPGLAAPEVTAPNAALH